MRNTASFLIAVSLGVGALEAAADSDIRVNIGACAEELRVPAFSPLARSLNSSVSITARIHLDQKGSVISIDFSGGNPRYWAEVRLAIDQSHFRSVCSNTILELTFTFEISGPPSYDSQVSVTFRGPNHFVLHTNPLLPSIDRTGRIPGSGKN